MTGEPTAAPTPLRGRELALVAPIYLGLALINLRAKLIVTPAWFDGTLERNHDLLLQRLYTNNEQSRVLQFWIPELLRRAFGVSLPHAYTMQRWLFVCAAFACFHVYLRKWFDIGWAFAGVAVLAAVMPLGAANDLQESAPLLLLTFVAGLWAIREQNLPVLLSTYAIGGLNNETMFFLPIAHFSAQVRYHRFAHVARVLAMTGLASLPLLLTQGPIRYINRDRPHLGGAWHWSENVHGIGAALATSPLDWYRCAYLYFVFVFGALWIYAILESHSAPAFLRRVFWIAPFFVVGHVVTGRIAEVRQMMPLGFIVVPLALSYLQRVIATDAPTTPADRNIDFGSGPARPA